MQADIPSPPNPAPPEPERRSQMLRSTGVVGSMTLLSRVLGLLRDVILARVFGAGIAMDAFVIANKIPNLLRRFFAEGAFSQAFVPVFSRYRQRGKDSKELADAVTGALGLVLFAVTAVGVLAAPVLVMIVAPGFLQDGERFDLSARMLRWTFPYLLFISLTALAGGILNSHRRFAIPAFTPALLNVVLIAAAVWLAPRLQEPAMALAIGVFVAGLVQLLFQLPALKAIGMLPRPRLNFRHPGVRRIGVLMLPAILGSSVAQINMVIDNIIASFLRTGSVSWLYYADRLMEFPLGVFGIALATVILPRLSEHHAGRRPEEFSAALDYALRLVLLIGVPAAAGLMVLATPLIATIFQGGVFDASDVSMASAALVAYSAGLLGYIGVKVLAPGYFARQDTRTPVRIALIALAANMLLNLIFVVTLLSLDVTAVHAGLAAATSVAALLNAGLLLRGLLRAGVYRPTAGWVGLFARVAFAAVAMTAVLWWLRGLPGDWTALAGWQRVGWLALAVGGGALGYFAALFAAGWRLRHLRGGRAGL